MSDPDFAAKAETELGFKITDNNVLGAREVFEIPSHREIISASARMTVVGRLVYLENEMIELKKIIEKLKVVL